MSSELLTKEDGEIIDEQKLSVAKPTEKTPAQAKADAIAAVTMTAYARASELKLTPEEDAALAADFPDEAFRGGAGGDSNLLYIEHAYLRDRFNNVLGRGAWSLVTRSRWTEEYKTSTGKDAVHVYSEVMLMIRGCFVAEAIGEMDYFPANAKTTYADAMEGSKTAAFRRLAKDFGVGLQAWKKGWCEGWWARRSGKPQQNAQEPSQDTPSPRTTFGPGWLKEIKAAKDKARLQWLADAFGKQNPNLPDHEYVDFGDLLDARAKEIAAEKVPA